MNTLRGARAAETEIPKRRRPSRPLLISLGLHVVLAIALGKVLISPTAFSLLFGRAQSKEVPAERIGFLRLPKAEGPPVAGRSGGDGRPITRTPPQRLVAPSEVPAGLPPVAPNQPPAEPEGGSGPLVGTGGPAQGIRPTYTGPRVWQAPGDIVSAPKSAKEKLDSAIVAIIGPVVDSVETAKGTRSPRDWTFEKNGRKWGLDSQYIRLGKVSIPSAVLALLPINLPNPTVADRERRSNQLHADIFWQAQRGMNEADFKKAVKSIRERKERERAAAEKQRRPEETPAARQTP